MASPESLKNSYTLKKGSDVVLTSNVATASVLPSVFIGDKSQSKVVIEVGQIQEYACSMTSTIAQVAGLTFVDVLDHRVSYVPNSFMVNGVAATPTLDAATNTLTYTLPAMTAGVAVVLTFQVRLNATS